MAAGLNKIIKVLDKRGEKATRNKIKKVRVVSCSSKSVAPCDTPSWAVCMQSDHSNRPAHIENEVS